MTVIGYAGTVSGYQRFGRKHLLKDALKGKTVVQASPRLQPRLDTARVQDRVNRVLRGGSIA